MTTKQINCRMEKTLVLPLRPPLTSFPESTSTKYPGAKSRITYIPATLTGNYSIKGAISPPLSSLLGLHIQHIDTYET